jgi:hypothetical protein
MLSLCNPMTRRGIRSAFTLELNRIHIAHEGAGGPHRVRILRQFQYQL